MVSEQGDKVRASAAIERAEAALAWLDHLLHEGRCSPSVVVRIASINLQLAALHGAGTAEAARRAIRSLLGDPKDDQGGSDASTGG